MPALVADPLLPVFFYGLFMDMDVLRARGIHPRAIEVVTVLDHRIHLGAKAMLVPATSGRARGILALLKRHEFDALYAGLDEYREEHVTAMHADGRRMPALTMVHPDPSLDAPSDPVYEERWKALIAQLRLDDAAAPLRVLGRRSSINVRKVLWLCAELAIVVDLEEWGQGALDLSSPEFLALNPNAMVPVIQDRDLVLWESNTICRYLAAREGRDDLLPVAPAARARVEQWMDWQATELNAAWRYAYRALVRKIPAHPDRAAVDASIAAWNRLMTLLDRELDRTGDYVTGPRLTLADIGLGLSINRWLMTPMDRPPLPAVEAYVDRLLEREPYRLHGANGLP